MLSAQLTKQVPPANSRGIPSLVEQDTLPHAKLVMPPACAKLAPARILRNFDSESWRGIAV